MTKAVLTTSWDDGHRRDVRLARMLQDHQLKATFYVAPENQELAKQDLLSAAQIRELSNDFEIGAHSMTHRRLPDIPVQEAAREIAESKAVLEQVVGREIKAFCYPGGAYTPLHVQLVRQTGYRYARTVNRYAFTAGDPYEAGTSVHVYNHKFGLDLLRLVRFAKFQPTRVLRCLEWDALAKAMFDHVIDEGGIYHIWGHSWEIEQHSYWERLEEVFRYISANPEVNYVTNGELEAFS